MSLLKRILNYFALGLSGLGLTLIHTSCQTTCLKMEPSIICPVQVDRFFELPSAFEELSCEELGEAWGQEYLLGHAFAKDWDLYRALTCYKRALILIPIEEQERVLQIEYAITLCYYLGNKYQDALMTFESSQLSQVSTTFPAFKNLLLIVYDCYLLTHQEEKADCVMQAISTYSPESEEHLELYNAFKQGEVDQARTLVFSQPANEALVENFITYDTYAKSPQKARMLNAILPGAGYYYVGEKRSAVTSFVINTLFTAAAYQFFHRGYYAAGAITASLEMGWYLGGINGAGIEANQFNTRLFEGVGRTILTKNYSFPILMFETSF